MTTSASQLGLEYGVRPVFVRSHHEIVSPVRKELPQTQSSGYRSQQVTRRESEAIGCRQRLSVRVLGDGGCRPGRTPGETPTYTEFFGRKSCLHLTNGAAIRPRRTINGRKVISLVSWRGVTPPHAGPHSTRPHQADQAHRIGRNPNRPGANVGAPRTR